MTDKELYEVLKRADNANTITNTLHTERIDYHSEYVPLIESNQDILRLHDEIERLKKEIFKYKKEIFKYKKEIFKYKEEAAKYKAERDKAVEDLADVTDCIICKYDDVCENSNSQGCCNGNWQWRGLDDKTSTVLLPDIDVEVEVHEIPVECALPQTVIEKIKGTLR